MYTLNLFIISRSRNKKWFFTVTKWLFHLVMFISLCEKENNAIWTTLILILGLSWLLHFVFSWCCTTEYYKTVHKILTLFFTWKALWRFKSEAEETSAKLETYIFSLCAQSLLQKLLFSSCGPSTLRLVDKDLLNRWIYFFIHRAWITTHIFWFPINPVFFLIHWYFPIYIAAAFPRFQFMCNASLPGIISPPHLTRKPASPTC